MVALLLMKPLAEVEEHLEETSQVVVEHLPHLEGVVRWLLQRVEEEVVLEEEEHLILAEEEEV